MKMAADGSQISLTRRNKPGTKAKVKKITFHLLECKQIAFALFVTNLTFDHFVLISLLNYTIFCLGCLHCQQFLILLICESNSMKFSFTFSLQDYCRWPDEPFEEMDSTLAVQQYIQQLIKNDPSNIDLILTNPETHDEGVWKYEHLRFQLQIFV